jgi:phosphatidylinositol glycan class V
MQRDVGFLRYWTVSNIPLFLLATPMLALLTTSSIWAFNSKPTLSNTSDEVAVAQNNRERRLLRSLAVPEFLLAAMALTSYHVQIITRLSSGYPVWYFWLATQLMESDSTNTKVGGKSGISLLNRIGGATSVAKYMVLYAVIQGGLFASFLPPA